MIPAAWSRCSVGLAGQARGPNPTMEAWTRDTVVMCGRYTSPSTGSDIAKAYGAEVRPDPAPPSWNVAPTRTVNLLVERPAEHGGTLRQLTAARWGLVPIWSKGPGGAPLINARVETIATKPSFRTAFVKRRGVIPAVGGYYEWVPAQVDGKTIKVPSYIHPEGDGQTLSLAALYEWWADPTKEQDDPDRWLLSTTIITTDATEPEIRAVHDRTPVILPADRVAAWLDPTTTDSDDIAAILTGIELAPMEVREVSRAVNQVRNDGPDLIAPIGQDRPLLLAFAA